MNEYLVEDEYSFYEIDPECRIGLLKDQKGNRGIGKTEQERKRDEKCHCKRKRNSRRACSNCSCLLVCYILFNGIISPNRQRMPDRKH